MISRKKNKMSPQNHHYKRFFEGFCTQKVKPNLTMKDRKHQITGKEKARK
jgi:hypothetical protein